MMTNPNDRVSNKTPKVSIGMPIYNGMPYLEEAIDSILAQTFTDFELIISDNASTDDTEQICRRCAQSDTRIRYYRNEKNIGANPNYNAVFNLSSAKYFKWASSNDRIHKEMLLKCVEILDKYPDIVLCYPKTQIINEKGDVIEDYNDSLDLQHPQPSNRLIKFLRYIRLNNVMNGMIRSEILKKTSLIENYFSSDIILMAELSLYGKFYEIPEFLFYRRMEPGSSTRLKSKTDLIKHYDPELKNPMIFQYWRIYYNYFSLVARSVIKYNEKMRLYKHLLRRVISARKRLATDLLSGLNTLYSINRNRLYNSFIR